MTEEVGVVWDRLSGHALKARTLTPATVEAFRDLCAAIVLRDALHTNIIAGGFTFLKVTVDGAGVEHQEKKKNPLLADHRGWQQRVEQGLIRFKLSPIGKELAEPQKPEDPFAEFDQETSH